ncbi:hypothetical protein [Alteromonas gracilis]|uniref:hypothetical protein n=1 Tax=Alteromonas gracilis TaxID=1479524 RepID=UPI003736DED7
MSQTILIVEDDMNIRKMLNIALGAEGFYCVDASTVRDAISMFNRHYPSLKERLAI